jgi:hypothetical protein
MAGTTGLDTRLTTATTGGMRHSKQFVRKPNENH